jgi:hypothetical protein
VSAAKGSPGRRETEDAPAFWRAIREQQHDFFQVALRALWRLSLRSRSSDQMINGRLLCAVCAEPSEGGARLLAWAKDHGGHATLFRSARCPRRGRSTRSTNCSRCISGSRRQPGQDLQPSSHVRGVLSVETHLADFVRDTADGRDADAILRACVRAVSARRRVRRNCWATTDGPRGRIYLIKQLLEKRTLPPRRSCIWTVA